MAEVSLPSRDVAAHAENLGPAYYTSIGLKVQYFSQLLFIGRICISS